jgi:uncharacterized membrane protein YwaF
VLIPALGWLFTRVVAERMGVVLLSAIVAHTAWHWMTERWTALAEFPFPVMDALAWAALMRWMIAAVVTGGLLWWLSGVVRRWEGLEADDRRPGTT